MMQLDHLFPWLSKRLLTVLFLLCVLSFASNNWVWQTVTLFPKITVKVPGTPIILLKASSIIYQVHVKDSFEVQAMVIDYGAQGLDKGVIDSLVNKDFFLNKIVDLIKTNNDTLISINKGMHQNKYRYFDFAYKGGPKSSKDIIYQRYVFYKQLGVLIVFKVPEGKILSPVLQSRVYQSLKIDE